MTFRGTITALLLAGFGLAAAPSAMAAFEFERKVDEAAMPSPSSIAVDPAGNLFVANLGSGEIFKFDPAGEQLDRWGGAGIQDGKFTRIGGIGLDPSEDLLYVTDDQTGVAAQNRVQVLRTDGSFVRKWGQTGNGDGQFERPRGIAVGPAKKIAVADLGNHRVQLLGDVGNLSAKWGSLGYGDGPFFDNPNAIGFGHQGNVVVGDASGSIRVFDTSGEFIRRFAGQAIEPAEPGKFGPSQGVTDLVVDSGGRTIALDREHHRFQVFDSGGSFLSQFGTEGAADGQFRELAGIAVGPQDEIYISDVNDLGQAGRVQVFADPALDPPIDPNDRPPGGGGKTGFRIVKKLSNRKRGTVTLVVAVSGKGALQLQATRQTRKATARAKRASRVRLTVKPKPRFRKSLRRGGKIRLKVKLVFRPASGSPKSRRVPVVLRG